MTNRTPGPWRKTRHAAGLIKVEAANRVVCDGFAGEEANANLIAAAPDLLEAAGGALDRLRYLHSQGYGSAPEEKALANAITKAIQP